MVDFLASDVMRAAIPPALLIAVIASSMSVMILAHRLAFLTVGVSHATMAGLGLAIALSWPILPTAAVTAGAVALLLALPPFQRGLNSDAGTGVLFAGAMAIGIILFSSAGRNDVDLFGLLFGNILMVSAADMRWLLLGGTLILASLVRAVRPWWSIAFDSTAAAANGVPVTGYRLYLYAVVGLTVVMCVKLAGIVLTTGLLVLPAAAAWFWGRGLFSLWLLSLLFAISGTLGGLFIAYELDWPAGATVVLSLCALFLASWLVSAAGLRLIHGRRNGGTETE